MKFHVYETVSAFGALNGVADKPTTIEAVSARVSQGHLEFRDDKTPGDFGPLVASFAPGRWAKFNKAE